MGLMRLSVEDDKTKASASLKAAGKNSRGMNQNRSSDTKDRTSVEPRSWAEFFERVKPGDVPQDFMADRKDAPAQEREVLALGKEGSLQRRATRGDRAETLRILEKAGSGILP